MNIGAGVTAFVIGSVVVIYAIEYIAIRLAGAALPWPLDVTEACAACLPLPFAHAVWFIAVYRMVPYLARSLHLTSEPEGYEAELRPHVHDWRQEIRVHITSDEEPRRRAIYAPPVGYDDLRRVALAIQDGAAFSYPGLVDTRIVKRADFRRLRLWCVERGWAQLGETSNSGASLTRAGRAAMRAVADCPTPLPSMYSVKGAK